MSYYKSGTLLLSSAQNEASDQLWLISGDSFKYTPSEMQFYTSESSVQTRLACLLYGQGIEPMS